MDISNDILEQTTEWERIFWSTESPRLYKYRGDLYRDLFALQNNLVYIPSREQLNDPNESCLNLSDVYETAHLYELEYPPKEGESLEKGIKEMVDDIGVFSMCKSQKEECLWSYYANGHRGFCIEYDAKMLWNSFVEKGIVSCVLEVSYETQRIIATMNNIRGYIQKPVYFLRKTTASKSIKWEREQEVRFVFNVKSEYVDIPKESVTGIYIGERCTDDIDLIKKSAKAIGNKELKLYKMNFRKDSFDMYYEEISNN